jgi:SAM-dependent methyltransferase
MRSLTLRRQTRIWSQRADGWDTAPPPGLDRVVAAVLERVGPVAGRQVVDLGCGTGQLSLPLSADAGSVLAVDISSAMIERLNAKALAANAGNLAAIVAPVELIDLPPGSVDIVVSNYALHHLRDQDKEALVGKVSRWLRPGGVVVIGDMMFGRGLEGRDRAIIASKVAALARRGPGGWWRIAKNGVRFLFRVQERPISIGRWEELLRFAGFDDIGSRPVIHEAAIVWGRLPGGAGH